MKRILFLLYILMSPVLMAQETSLFDTFCRNMASSCAQLSYTYSTRMSGINTTGQGTLLVQDKMWKVEGNGVQMYCDSASTWVIDPSSKEVVIEPASSDPSETVITNPALMLSMVHSLFTITESLPTEDGKAVAYVLSPKGESAIDYLNLEILKAGAAVRNAWVAFDDGTLIKIEVSSMKLTPKVSDGMFRPQTVFDSSWIVTDLR